MLVHSWGARHVCPCSLSHAGCFAPLNENAICFLFVGGGYGPSPSIYIPSFPPPLCVGWVMAPSLLPPLFFPLPSLLCGGDPHVWGPTLLYVGVGHTPPRPP